MQATNLNCFASAQGQNRNELTVFQLFETKLANAPIRKAVFPATNVNSDPTSPNTGVYGINEQIRLSFRSTRFPKIALSLNGVFDISVACTLSGDLK